MVDVFPGRDSDDPILGVDDGNHLKIVPIEKFSQFIAVETLRRHDQIGAHDFLDRSIAGGHQ